MNPRKTALIFIFITLFITLFLDVLGMGLVVPILPGLVEELAGGVIDHATYLFGWLVGLYAPMQFLFAPIIGSLSDHFGRRTHRRRQRTRQHRGIPHQSPKRRRCDRSNPRHRRFRVFHQH
jgi:MFS family permease